MARLGARRLRDPLAGRLVVGHVLGGGVRATGGGYSFFTEVPGIEHLGFPIAAIREDGTAVITKPAAAGGLVDLGTVTSALLAGGLQAPMYRDPDVVADIGTVELTDLGENRVRVAGTSHRGHGAKARRRRTPAATWRSVRRPWLHRNSMTTFLAHRARRRRPRPSWSRHARSWGPCSRERSRSTGGASERTDRDDATTNDQAVARLTLTVKARGPSTASRQVAAGAAAGFALSGYPGAFVGPRRPVSATPYVVAEALSLPNHLVEHRAVTEDGTVIEVELVNPGTLRTYLKPAPHPSPTAGPAA